MRPRDTARGVGRGGGGKGRIEGGDRVGGNLAPWPLGGIDAPAGLTNVT